MPSLVGKDLEEGTSESSSPPSVHRDLRRRIYERLVAAGKQGESDPSSFRDMLCAHIDKLPERYLTDLGEEKADDVLLHQKVLDECARNGTPVFKARFLQCVPVQPNGEGTCPDCDDPTHRLLLQGLTLESVHGPGNTDSISSPSRPGPTLLHEIIFSSLDKPKLLSRLSSLLSEVELNIREAHVYSTTDNFCLAVFVVDGWKTEETDALIMAIKDTLTRKNGAPSKSASTKFSGKMIELRQQAGGDCEIDWSMLTMTERIASGSYADLYRGTYGGYDVCIKILRITHFNSPSEVDFWQQALILRRVNHENILKFYGTCTGHAVFSSIVTEYMPGGNLYDFLHKQNDVLGLLLVLKIAIQISKGMEYLHHNSIIHRDLKSANILLGDSQVVKIAGFGVAQHVTQDREMSAETGTYRWMAPEIINHKPYDHKADVFSFAIVLWELITLKVPYDSMTSLQAALGVRQGFRSEIPPNVHPGLSGLIEQCWDEDPDVRPDFPEIIVQLEVILQQVQVELESRLFSNQLSYRQSVFIQLEDILHQVQPPKGGLRRSKVKTQKKS